MNYYFDLDGTLIDARPRMYFLFQYLVPLSKLKFDDYWLLKGNKMGHAEILRHHFGYNEQDILWFEKEWLSQIELPKWLELDMPIQGVTEFLFSISKKHQIFIVTARQFADRALAQIGKFGWNKFVKDIFISNEANGKYELIKNVLGVNEKGYFIGDTGRDMEIGIALGFKTVAVLTGFLNREKLNEYHPDMIINSVIDLVYE